MMKTIILTLLFLIVTNAKASLAPFDVSLFSLSSKKNELLKVKKSKKGTVVIFLSKDCPCSKANMSYIDELSLEYKDFYFVGVHAKKGATSKEVSEYFADKKLHFDLFSDEQLQLADSLGALKTPQAFVLNARGEIVFSGGLTNTTNPENAKHFFLKDALNDLAQNKLPTLRQATSLGCYIVR